MGANPDIIYSTDPERRNFSQTLPSLRSGFRKRLDFTAMLKGTKIEGRRYAHTHRSPKGERTEMIALVWGQAGRFNCPYGQIALGRLFESALRTFWGIFSFPQLAETKSLGLSVVLSWGPYPMNCARIRLCLDSYVTGRSTSTFLRRSFVLYTSLGGASRIMNTYDIGRISTAEARTSLSNSVL